MTRTATHPLHWPKYTDFDKVAPKLYVGAELDPLNVVPEGFHIVAFCAREIQPKAPFPLRLRIIHCPLPDDRLLEREVRNAHMVADLIASHVDAGRRMLVTCHLGVNRSAFVAALALRRLRGWSGGRCLELLRATRHPRGQRTPLPGEHAVLTNPWFAAYLSHLDVP